MDDDRARGLGRGLGVQGYRARARARGNRGGGVVICREGWGYRGIELELGQGLGQVQHPQVIRPILPFVEQVRAWARPGAGPGLGGTCRLLWLTCSSCGPVADIQPLTLTLALSPNPDSS